MLTTRLTSVPDHVPALVHACLEERLALFRRLIFLWYLGVEVVSYTAALGQSVCVPSPPCAVCK